MKRKNVPNEIIIGRRFINSYPQPEKIEDRKIDELAFFTFKDDGKINSENSWEGWRDKEIDPLVLKNEFVEGWKIDTEFHQRSGWNSNRKLFVIMEPRTGYKFEMDVALMTKLLQNIEIKNGIIQGKYALTRERGLINEADYDAVTDDQEIKYITPKTIKLGDIILKGAKLEKYVFVGKRYGLSRQYYGNETKEESFYLFISVKPNKYGNYLSHRANENFKYKTQFEHLNEWQTFLKKFDIKSLEYYYYYINEKPLGPDDKYEIKIEKKDNYGWSIFYLDRVKNQLYRIFQPPEKLMPIKFNGKVFVDDEGPIINKPLSYYTRTMNPDPEIIPVDVEFIKK